jgi:hypothetical protein
MSEEYSSHQPGEGETARAFGGYEVGQGRELLPVPGALLAALGDGPRPRPSG